jgi:hypothetical protein
MEDFQTTITFEIICCLRKAGICSYIISKSRKTSGKEKIWITSVQRCSSLFNTEVCKINT